MNPKKTFIVTMALLAATFVISLTPAFAQVDTAWVRRYNGPGNTDDEASAIAVDTCGNVYVTGMSGDATNAYFVTIKYYPSGDTAWVRRYKVPGNNYWDYSLAIVVYGCDRVYVTGESGDTGYTIAYDADGNRLWIQWGGADIAVDSYGNVYVTGMYEHDHNVDYLTVKYYPNGASAWERGYAGPDSLLDEATAIALDDSGNVYVTGLSEVYGGAYMFYAYATIKYDPYGDSVWVRRYCVIDDRATDIAVDDSGYVYVTGWCFDHDKHLLTKQTGYDVGTELLHHRGLQHKGGPLDYHYNTIKYHPYGDTVWVREYDKPGSRWQTGGEAIALDGSGNIYVTGMTDAKYVTIKYHPNGDTAWLRSYSEPGEDNDWAKALAIDDYGNVYVTGYAGFIDNSPYSDYATIKYDSLGTLYWAERYNGSGNGFDVAYDIAIDDSGNVYVTGTSFGGTTDDDYVTIKYIPTYGLFSPNGGEGWQAGQQYPITWSSQNFTGNVRIDYSINGGASFDSVIVSTYPNTGQYQWTVPSRTSSTHCRVRVCDAVDYNPADSSDNDFIIYICGDVNGDGKVSAGDIVYLINYLFIGGPKPPGPKARADVNGDGNLNASDIVRLINYLFINGQALTCFGL